MITVKELIEKLKKMPQSKEVCFFNHDNEVVYTLDNDVWNIPDEKLRGTLYKNWVEIAGKSEGGWRS